MRICFSGINGTGKTTLSSFTESYFEEKYPARKVICLHSSRLREFPAVLYKLIVNSFLGSVIICDRYIYDYIVIIFSRFLYERYFLSKLLIFVAQLAPKFDLLIYLQADFETLKIRTDDISYGRPNYDQRIWLYSVINQILGSKIINTSGDISLTKKLVASYIDNCLQNEKCKTG